MKYKVVLPYLIRLTYNFGQHKLHSSSSNLICNPFFIMGSGRNGSTLLSMILNGHSRIFIPGEQYALHYASMRFQLYNFLMWRDIVKIVVGEFADKKNNQGWDTNFNALYAQLYDIPKKERSFQKIIEEIYKEVANQTGEKFSMWGDKSPPNTRFLKYIYRVYPKSKYIFLIRDGRDVVSSYKDGGYNLFKDMSLVKNAALNWTDCIDKWNWLKKRIGVDQLLEVHYEDLVKNPEIVVNKILVFLDLENEEGILNYKEIVRKRLMLDIPYHQGLAESVNQKSIGSWEIKLNRDDLSLVMPIMEKGLKDYKYL